jgi:predicted cupin superfamily sugar epimerase
MTADEVIKLLGLRPHPEGGHFHETFRDARTVDGKRAVSTAVYYLLKRGERSHWHRIDAAEVWHFYGGASLSLRIVEDGKTVEHVLGMDLARGERPLLEVPAGDWQSAESLGDWTLTGCTVAPGFEFAGFEMAPKDWTP